MRRRHAVFGGGIAGLALAITGCELALTGHALFQPRANFFSGGLFEWIGAAEEETREKGRDEEERPGLHPLILGSKP